MNTELLTCRRVTAGLIYPQMAIQSVDLNRLFAMITERYPYQNLQHLPDGIRMANPEGDCFVQQARMQINESVQYFEASKEKILDIFKMVSEKLNLQQFMTFGVKLTSFLPLDNPGKAAEIIEAHALSITPAQWQILGAGRKGTGLRIVLHQEGVHEIKIEPFFNDSSQLYVELDVQHPQPFVGLGELESKMDAAYSYMFGNIKDFLNSIE